jgi:hypothetical protein
MARVSIRAVAANGQWAKLRMIVEASIDGADGSQTYASVFFHNRRLYQIEGTVPAGGSTADGIRFQQSFDFTDGWRLPDALSNERRPR